MESEELRGRLARVFAQAEGVEKILLMNTDYGDPNFFYLTGFTSGLFEYSYLVVEKQGMTLFTSSLEYATAKEQAPKGLTVVQMDDVKKFRAELKEKLAGFRVGVNESFIPYAAYKAIRRRYRPRKMVDISEAFSKARLVKSEYEIDLIKKAVKITKWAMVLIQKDLKEGMTELQLAARFDGISAEIGSEGPSFKTIVCFGKNAALPHHSPDHTKLKYGDFVLIDAGAKVSNYCSDITRTALFGDDKSRIPDYQKKERMLRIVKEAQVKAIKKIKPGVKGAAVHRVAQKVIDTADKGIYKGTFIHSLGHSLGIEVHDGPGFSPGAKQVLKPGMIITAEPGIYVEGFGGVRIEDDVLVTETGTEVI